MLSRAHLLIERDYENLQKNKLWGIEAELLNEDNIFEWSARILGLKNTPWEGGVFRLYIKFDEHYNVRPPQVCFHTIPFHPNVDMITGKPCVDFLDDWSCWQESCTLSFILLTIQSMLSNPVLTNPVNIEAVNLIMYSPHTYKQMVEDCVSASQRVEAGLIPHMEDDNRVKIAAVQARESQNPAQQVLPPSSAPRRRAKISFEDYHLTWSGIATSKSNPDAENPLLEAIKDNKALQSAHYGLPIEELQAQMEKQMQEQSQLMYGKFRPKSNKPTHEDLKEAKMEKISQMRKIYLQPKGTPRKPPIQLGESRLDEPWEEEVDELVAWTNKLDTEAL